MAPAAPSVWPIMLLLLVTASLSAWAPKAERIAFVSLASLSGVLVPWAMTSCTCSGATSASRSAFSMARPDE